MLDLRRFVSDLCWTCRICVDLRRICVGIVLDLCRTFVGLVSDLSDLCRIASDSCPFVPDWCRIRVELSHVRRSRAGFVSYLPNFGRICIGFVSDLTESDLTMGVGFVSGV